MNPIGNKIDEFIAVELKAHPEQVEHFFERVLSNYEEVVRTSTRFFLLTLAAWFLTYAIHEEWIGKLEWLGFEFNRKMTIISPFLIGLLSYGMLSTFAGALVLWEAIIQRLRYMLPIAWGNYLDNFIAPPTFSNIERMLEPIIDHKPLLIYFSRAWFLLVTGMIFSGGLVGIAHTTYLLLQRDVVMEAAPPTGETLTAHWGVIATSAVLGLVSWIRGVVLCASAIEATGGYNLSHHRGVRTMPPPDQAPPGQEPLKDATSAPPAPPPPVPSSLAPSSQPPSSTNQPSVAPAPIYHQARLLDLRRAGVVIVVERKKRRRRFNVRS